MQVNHVRFTRSTDNGKSFESPKDFGPGNSPNMDIISNNVYVAWSGISFKAGTNNGASFGSTKTFGNDANEPRISSSGNAVRIVWTGSTSTGPNDIFFIASGNEGSSFDSIKNLSNNIGDSIQPQIISSGGNVYAVWSDNTDSSGGYRTFFKKGVD